MLSPKANIHCSNLSNCETELPDLQQHLHRHPVVNGNSHSRVHNEQKFQQSQSQHLSSNINRRGSSSNALPPHMTTLSSSSSVTNSTLRRKSSSCYQQQLLSTNAINCSTNTLNDCNNDISLARYSPHPNDLFLQHQLYHQHRKPSLQPIERFDDSLACCLPPPSPAPNSDRFIEGTCVISPPSGGGPGQTEGQHPSQTQHQQQTLSSSTSNSSISTGVGSSSSSSTCAFQPAPSHHSLKYSANQSINAMQRSISPSTTRFRINNDRYRDISSANSSPSVNTAPGSSSVVMPSSTRFVNLSSHFPYQNCTTPSLVSTDTYSYLASTVHTPVKRYVPTPPPPNQLYVSSDQHHTHQQINIQTPTQIPANSAAITSKSSSSINTSTGSSVGTSTTMPYRVQAIKCCGPDQANDPQAALNLNQSNDYYSSSPRLRNSYNCNKTAGKDSSMMVNFNESQTAQQAISSKSSNMMASQNSSSTTQTHMVATIMGCGNGGISSPPSNLNSRPQTYTSRNGLCSALNDLQEPMSLNSTITSMNDVSQSTTCPNVLRSEENSTSAGISIGSGTSSTCLHCKTVRRTTGVHQTTQTTGPISPVPQMAPLITTNNNSSNNANQGLSNEQMTNITMTLTPTPTESSNHITPITPPTNSMTPSNRLLYKKLDISPDQMFPTQLKAISNNNQIVQPHINEPNLSQSSNLEHFLPTSRTLNQQQLPSNQPISQPANSTLQQQQRYSCKKRFTQYMRREVLRFFGIEPSTEAEDYGLWQGRQRRLALRRFGSLKTESELQAEFNDVCSNDNGSGSMPRSNILCSAFNNENQHHHYHHHHHNHQRHTTERPDILPFQDTEDDVAVLNNSGSGGDSTGNNGVNNGVNSLHGRGGRCQRDRYHHPHYNVDFQVGDHVERKASVASMLVQSFSFIKHTLNKHQTSRYKRRQWSRSFAPAHVQYHMNNGGHVTSNEFYEGLSALQDDEVFFDSPPGVESSGVMGSGSGTVNASNNTTNISNSSVNSSMRVTSVERQMFISGERSQQGWRTSNIIGQNDGSLTVHQPIVVHASAEQQITHQQHSMQQHQQQLHGIRGNRISAQLLDGVLENSQRPVARRIKLFCTNDLDDRTDHRPFFTYWINTVQIIVLFFSLLCYGIGPIGFGVEQRTGQVLVTSLSLQTVQHSEQRNVWIGPRNQDLVHMGAKFATCMRRDVKIIDVVMKTRRQERETACCIRNDDSGCVQSSQADCSVRGLFPTKSISTWKKWSPGESGPGGRISGSVCGLDPKYCDAPASIAPYEWPDDITKWPICRKTNSFSQRFRFKDHTAEHMVCEVIGHPCCTGIYGECQITTREYCDFVNGYFHEEASLCSQISCLSNVCGMFPFVNVEVPDQFYRLLTSLCMHAGILHLVITVVFQHIFLADLERLIGPIRTAILYIGTGLAGNLTSAVLVPYKPEVGPLASLSGVIASLVVLLIHAHWQQLHKPHIALFKLIVIGAVLFAIGTLPWQLNFASLFAGIFCGIFLTIALVPFVSINKYKRKSKINLIWSCIIFHIFVYTTMLIIFYMFSSELTKLTFGEVFTNSFNTGVTGSSGGGGGATGSPGITTTDIMRTGISSNNNNNNNNNVNKTLATQWALNLLKTTKQNAQQQQQQKPTEIKPGLAIKKATKPSFNFLTENRKKAQILKEKLLNDSNMLTPIQKQESLDSQKQESLDFNSKRRRGRLRLSYETKQNLVKNEKHQQQQQQQQQLEYNVPAILFINNVAKVITTLLLTHMLAFIQQIKQHKFVYKPQQQKQKSQVTVKQPQKQQQQNSPYKKPAENLVLSLIKHIIIKTKTNNHNKQKRKQTSTTLSTSSSAAISSSNNNPLLPYAFLFLITLLILPCHQPHNGLAEAAKPKSATQHSNNNNHLQHQQQQDKPNIAYAAGADNVHIDKEGTVLTPPSYQVVSSQTSNEEETEYILDSDERNFDLENESINEVNEEQEDDMQEQERDSYEKYDNDTHYENATVIKTPLFPKDLFTKEQLENGAVVCHIIGVIYMFVALAIVCDEFFVPSLDVIIEKLGITDDVAGATFMAAGGSAPELFTSVIGVFVSFDDVGIGTIVGSAVFNILFVIGMCALFSKTVLTLTWWPLFRDCTFYSISLMVLIYFFRDNLIYWWEALILFSIYCAYVTFMKWNVEVETCVKRVITKNKVTRVRSTDQLMPAGNAANSSETSMATQPGGSVTSRAASESRSGPPGSSSGAGTTGNSSGANASSTQTGAKFRHGLLQLMIHTIDPLHDGKVDEKATQLHAIASLKVLLDATKPQRGGATTSAANHVKINLKETTLADRPNGNIDTTLDSPSLSGRRASWIDQRVKIQTRKFSIKQTQEIEDEPEPLSMAWPDTARKRLTYILVAPLLIPMWLTLPDTRTPKGKKLFPVTFIGSIVWIAAFSYLMVWWANVAGDTARIPPEVMGLTFLAAGTSIPDLITSVIVARKGFGDMAVSSSVGSNIFDVTVGLPIPWLLFGIFYGAPVEVNSVGMVCSITILFMMLIFVVMSIACFRWRMNKGLGFTMFLLYFVFVAVSLMFEYDVITCPV